MIDIAVKHYILEYCINQLFTTMSRNFATPKNLLNELKIGKTYRKVILKYALCVWSVDDIVSAEYTNFRLNNIKVSPPIMNITYDTKTSYHQLSGRFKMDFDNWFEDGKCGITYDDIVDFEIFD